MGQPADLRDLIIRHARGGIRRNIVNGLSLGVVTDGTPPAATMSEPSVTLVAGGSKRTAVGDLEVVYGAGEYLVVSIDLPVTGRVERATPDDPFVVFSLALRPAVIAALLLDTVEVARPPAFTGLAVGTASPDLLDAASRMLRLLDDPADLAALGAAAEREIVWRLLSGPQGGIVRQIGVADGSLAHISRAIRWMRDHLAEQVAIEELARISGMSASTFHRHFRAATSMTPIQWQKALRLREARALLLRGAAGVAEAGYAVGFGSASQFSREYRRAFGQPPGRDAQNFRGDDAPAAPIGEGAWIP
ncbi:AraC family transcriptional regulator N-terminal domain-containing protein [Leifsonia poae]|uniref:AraC family transcriptional regulator n=1 Tax=Leifsonia poae TaxID=110933 RepID=UPI003D689495